jgi:hypothetical protein
MMVVEMGNDWDGEAWVRTHSGLSGNGIDSDSDVKYRGSTRLDKELSSSMGNRLANMHVDAHMRYLATDTYKSRNGSGSGLGDLIQTGTSILSLAKLLL